MNTVLNSYGQLCGCPEILKKSYKFFCRGLDIRVTESRDLFLYHKIDRTEKSKNNSSGSSTHKSSSGTRHGGGGGKF